MLDVSDSQYNRATDQVIDIVQNSACILFQMNEPTDSIEDRQESALQVLTYKQVTVQMLTTIDQT